jgi:short-subunit dehydrogenase
MSSTATARRSAILTGASAGIGEALAIELARRGWDLGLTARRLPALEALQQRIHAAHPDRRVEVRALDVADTAAVQRVIPELATALGSLDLIVANAGIGHAKRVGTGHLATDVDIIQVNLIGAMATVDTAIPIMRRQGSGHIVGITSLAGVRGMPTSASYSASKAGFHTYLEAARTELAAQGIKVSTISPGFIDTAINQHQRWRPFLITPETGARKLADLIDRGVRHATLPFFPWAAIGMVFRTVPNAMWDFIAAQLQKQRD